MKVCLFDIAMPKSFHAPILSWKTGCFIFLLLLLRVFISAAWFSLCDESATFLMVKFPGNLKQVLATPEPARPLNSVRTAEGGRGAADQPIWRWWAKPRCGLLVLVCHILHVDHDVTHRVFSSAHLGKDLIKKYTDLCNKNWDRFRETFAWSCLYVA